MSLWVDKYRPTSLSKLDYHKDQAKWLGRLVSRVTYAKEPKKGSFIFVGSDRGLATSAGVWAFWCWQENTYHVYPEGVVWQWSR